MNLLKRCLYTFFVALCLIYAAAVFHNNLGDDQYSQDEINQQLSKTISWLEQNQSKIQNDHNSILWWMLTEANTLKPDSRLERIIQEYKTQNAKRFQSSPWAYLLTGKRDPYINYASIYTAPYYDIFMNYGFSCSSSLAQEPLVKIQNETSFCWKHHPFSPACTTHQLFGLRFMQRTGCEDQAQVSEKIEALTDQIQLQATLDFRVVDVYIQRLVTLLDSGKQHKVKPRWIKRLLGNQHQDGGWGGFDPILPVGGGRYIGFKQILPGIANPDATSDFHATAQMVWLLSILANPAGVNNTP